ncbi:MAG: hypothetical protein BroJett003_24860 [Planctomycetota bacterium]|nr:MAG: hypothetical protein BroJett003_24860 [Planctomycetota bacterium]
MSTATLDSSSHLPHDPVSLFCEQVSESFLEDVVRCFVTTWRDADQKAREWFPEPERHDLQPHLRRAMLECELRGVATRHGLSASSTKNSKGTASFTQVVSGRVIITASAVPEPNDIVRHAEFRFTFARSNQLSLFGEPAPAIPDSPLYALILHGPGATETDESGKVVRSTAKPGFVDVVFPAPIAGTPDKIEYVGGRLRLLERYANVLTEGRVAKAEVVEFIAEPKLREQETRKEA